ncbi:apolipoprotein L1 isoform X3 [Misgurnus anguillicaudatus]|uniref:apolipoprotein L1 isoform X3 n=1 Tax=Misgurnus anguillicaudatus TaxID=75329 RepID=UPI003CCF44F1
MDRELPEINDNVTHYTAVDKGSCSTSETETVDPQTHEMAVGKADHTEKASTVEKPLNLSSEEEHNSISQSMQMTTQALDKMHDDTECEIPKEEENLKVSAHLFNQITLSVRLLLFFMHIQDKGQKKKPRNPFMPQAAAKSKIVQNRNGNQESGNDIDSEETEDHRKSLNEWLDEFRSHESQRDDEEDLNGLMDWWSTVEQWEDMPKGDSMTEKEEAEAFALTAEKVQKGIRVFNKLFSERAEGLWQHVIDLHAIADGLDRFNKKTKIAQITGGSTSALGGIATITGFALAPFTMGASLIVTAVGLGVAMAGALTSASAGISNTVNNSMDRKKVERIVEDYQEKMADLDKCMKFIKQGITNLRKFNLNKIKKQAYNRDFPAFDNLYEDGAMAGKAVLSSANEIMRVMQIANAAGTSAVRAAQIASISTGVLTGLFVGMDIYFVAKDSHELKNGAKSEFAAKIREVAEQLQEGLVELNSIREELQFSNTVKVPPEKPLQAPL